ncbi:MAG: ABC transporter permease [Acidobacteria bacterium]|nr:ABC transporter permease [Acidobacteriota bacterium]
MRSDRRIGFPASDRHRVCAATRMISVSSVGGDEPDLHDLPALDRLGVPSGRRDRHHEHHVRDGDGTHPRDRGPDGGGRGPKNVQAQFLLEALVLGSLSGLAGAVLGVAASGIFSRALSWPTIIPPQWIVIAVAFSVVIGVFFGFYAARKAALLDPIEALRYE